MAEAVAVCAHRPLDPRWILLPLVLLLWVAALELADEEGGRGGAPVELSWIAGDGV
jgi:hypothetical protein